MYLSKLRLALILLPTITIIVIYITASGRGIGKNLAAPSIKLPSVVVDGTVGGLGNQLFRYAFAYTLAAQLKTDLYVEVNSTRLPHRTFDSGRREFMLDYFQIPFNTQYNYRRFRPHKPEPKPSDVKVEFLPPRSIANIPAHRRFSYTETNYQLRDPIPADRVLVVEDYWESEAFFNPQKLEIRKQFQFNVAKITHLLHKHDAAQGKHKFDPPFRPYAQILEDIQASESVALHFRIGDFSSKTHSLDHVLPFSFQLRAIKILCTFLNRDKKKYKFFVFSDDIEYVKSAVDFSKVRDTINDTDVVFVSPGRFSGQGNSLLEFYLMTQCKHFIIPNSTYSWWAAYLSLNPARTILGACPKNNASYYDKYENLNVRAYKRMLGTNILYAYPRNWYTLNPFELVKFP